MHAPPPSPRFDVCSTPTSPRVNPAPDPRSGPLSGILSKASGNLVRAITHSLLTAAPRILTGH
ncbi:hypothetical protein FAIPA1_200035 [Frankia sp. AiPs1]